MSRLKYKFGALYVLIIFGVLILMNTYPLLVSQNLVFRSKQSTLETSAAVLVSALSGLSELNEQNVTQAMTLVEEMNVSRVLVTNEAGWVLYDSRETDSAVGRYAFYTEMVQALSGNNAFCASYDSEAFHSRAASPVIYRSDIIGAVMIYEYDVEQGTLLHSLQQNLMTISLGIAAVVVALSLGMTASLGRQIQSLLTAIRRMGEGAYGTRAEVRGRDEISQIAHEFNRLADRLQTTEDKRRQFVADASHELKTPLAGIRLLSDSILQADMDEATVREFVGDIGQEAERLSRITQNLLRLTRLDSGALEEAYPVAIEPVARRVMRMLGLVAREKKVHLICDIQQDGWVLATKDDLHQVIYNLAENAVKYSNKGGFVRISLHLEAVYGILVVEDDGIGIPDEDMERIFDRFYRVDKARSRAAGGTGLGLSIVSATLQRRGGDIAVSHRTGGGTRFEVRWPLAQEGGDRE